MKKRFLLLFLSLSLAAVGLRGVPCVGMESFHSCCQKFSNHTIANPYKTCCDDDEQKKEDPTSTPKVQNDFQFQVAVIHSTIVPSDHPQFVVAFHKIQNKSPPKSPIYLSNESLLL